jgi:hypothetical protein
MHLQLPNNGIPKRESLARQRPGIRIRPESSQSTDANVFESVHCEFSQGDKLAREASDRTVELAIKLGLLCHALFREEDQ